MKKWLKYGIGILILLAACFAYAHVDKKHNLYDAKTDSSQYVSSQIEEGTSVEEEFVCGEDSLDGISVKLVLVNAPQEGELTYELWDESEEKLASGEIPAADIKSGRMRTVKFGKTFSGSKGKTYRVVFGASGFEEGKGVGVYYDPVGTKQGTLKIKGQEVNGTMILRSVTHRFDLETFLITLVFAVYIILFLRVLYRLFS